MGGDLLEGQVVIICDLQPLGGPELAAQVSRNLDSGIRYLYFLYFSEDTIQKVCQALQIILVAGVDGAVPVTDFAARLRTVSEKKDQILAYLKRIYSDRSLRISLLPSALQFHFRVHNATDQELARLYLRYRGCGFIPWSEGESALSIMRDLPRHLFAEERDRIFFPLKEISLSDEEKRRFEIALDRGLARYFPEIQDEVRCMCLGR
jgi:hypothetical protein